jgi:hypothetical protein
MIENEVLLTSVEAECINGLLHCPYLGTFFVFYATAPIGPGPPHSRVIDSSQRPVTDNTQHSQQTDIHAPGVIRTDNFSRRAAVDLRLRPRCNWDRPFEVHTGGRSNTARRMIQPISEHCKRL